MMNGMVDQSTPQPNQPNIRIDYFTKEEFPLTVELPLEAGIAIKYKHNIFNCQATINYDDNLPTCITDKWYYDICTVNG